MEGCALTVTVPSDGTFVGAAVLAVPALVVIVLTALAMGVRRAESKA